MMDEVQRIKDAYSKRKIRINATYSEYYSRQREREIKRAIRKVGIIDLINKKILDVGCGNGAVLKYFLKDGAQTGNLYGIDLLPERIEEAEERYTGISFICGNAELLPYPDEFFDIITQSTVFTSVLDNRMKEAMAAEMIRVLKMDGTIIWHDFRFDNPLNPNVKGIGRGEIKKLYHGCQFDFKLISLNPFIARPLSRFSWWLCDVLEKISILRTHWLVTIRK